MKPQRSAFAPLACASLLFVGLPAWAGDAETSASASGDRRGPGVAAASARYSGAAGFARTDTRTGDVNLARGVALGVDENGLSFSLSTAVAGRLGPAIATNFNMSIDRHGNASTSVGRAVAIGGEQRGVSIGGAATSRPVAAAVSSAAARSTGAGIAHAGSHSSGVGVRGVATCAKKASHERVERRVVRVRRVVRR